MKKTICVVLATIMFCGFFLSNNLYADIPLNFDLEGGNCYDPQAKIWYAVYHCVTLGDECQQWNPDPCTWQ